MNVLDFGLNEEIMFIYRLGKVVINKLIKKLNW